MVRDVGLSPKALLRQFYDVLSERSAGSGCEGWQVGIIGTTGASQPQSGSTSGRSRSTEKPAPQLRGPLELTRKVLLSIATLIRRWSAADLLQKLVCSVKDAFSPIGKSGIGGTTTNGLHLSIDCIERLTKRLFIISEGCARTG